MTLGFISVLLLFLRDMDAAAEADAAARLVPAASAALPANVFVDAPLGDDEDDAPRLGGGVVDVTFVGDDVLDLPEPLASLELLDDAAAADVLYAQR